jgi:hypothetical protein
VLYQLGKLAHAVGLIRHWQKVLWVDRLAFLSHK